MSIDRATTMLSEDMDKATTTFVAVATNTEPEPTATDAKATSLAGEVGFKFFKVSLSQNGNHLGYLGQDDNQWVKIVSEESALTLEHFPYNGVNYYRNTHDTSRYISVNDRAYVGFYNWSGATGFTRDGSYLRSDYNGQYLSYDSKENKYLTFWDPYVRLDLAFKIAR